MKQYLRERNRQGKLAAASGLAVTVAIHAVAAVILFTSGMKYLYPPPPEQSFVIDFEEDEPLQPRVERMGDQPRSEEVDKTKPIELVQESESPYVAATKRNSTPAAKPDTHGDVEVPTPKQEEPKLDPRASFPGMSKKDSSYTAPHSAEKAGDNFKEGQPKGNTTLGKTDGTPNAHLQGRKALGSLPKPSYPVQKSGKVVVEIWVDQYGTVQKASPGADGTTVTDNALWAAARKAAMEAHFNQSADAPALQKGTITYIFNLK